MSLLHKLRCGATLAVWLVCIALCGRASAYDPYAPSRRGQAAASVLRQGVEALRELPSVAREACMAERFGLLFAPESSGSAGARCFVDSAGALHSYDQVVADTCAKTLRGRSGREVWAQAQRVLDAVDDDEVFSYFAGEVTRMARQMAAYHLRALPEPQRDACLARWAGVLYRPGASAEEAAEPEEAECAFIDSHGRVQEEEKVWQTAGSEEEHRAIAQAAIRCAEVAGEAEVLALFPVQVNAMLHYRESLEGVLPGVANAPKLEPVDSPAVSALKALPRTVRWAFFAELMQLTYMADGLPGADARLWVRPNALFVGSDGLIYDFWREQGRVAGSHWLSLRRAVQAEGRESVLAAFADESRAMRQAVAARRSQSVIANTNRADCGAAVGSDDFPYGLCP